MKSEQVLKIFIFWVLLMIVTNSIGANTTKADRFIDNQDGTITDSITGLIWQKIEPSEKYTWKDALSYCEKLTLAG